MNETTQKNTSKLSDSVLADITAGNVKPIPKLTHVFRNNVFFVMWGVTVLVGSCAIALIAFTELNVGWEYYEMTHDNALTFFVNTFPVLWIFLLGAMTGIGYYNIRNTKHGYRYPLSLIVVCSIGASLIGGFILHSYGVSKDIDDAVNMLVPFHHSVGMMQREHWLQEDRGLYAGVIIDSDDGDVFSIKGFDGRIHEFDTEFLPAPDVILITQNNEVGVVGAFDASRVLVACRLFLLGNTPGKTFKDIQKRRAIFHEEFLEVEDEIHVPLVRSNPCMERIRLSMPPS